MEVMEATLAGKYPRRLILDDKEAETENLPDASLAQEAAPALLPGVDATSYETNDAWVGPHLRAGVEILGAMGAKAQPFGFEGRNVDHRGWIQGREAIRSGFV